MNTSIAHALLLGAGASVSSGIQSASDCIWEWKKDIFASKNSSHAARFTNHRDEQVRQYIQRWLDNEASYPKLNDPNEYSFYAQKAYPIEGDRQSYFKNLIEGKRPGIGYQMMCLLAQSEIIRSVWTTNFDNLAYKAAIQMNMEASNITLGNVAQIYQPYDRNNLLCIALHGDYKYGPMKNTAQELDTQEDVFINTLTHYLTDKSLIVCGYSGRDNSLMDALTKVYQHRGAGRLYWCGRGLENLNPKIEKLLYTARASGRVAYYIPTEGFDELMISLTKACFETKLELQSKMQTIIASSPIQHDKCSPFTMEIDHFNNVLKGNLFPIRFPASVFQFELLFDKKEENPWDIVKDLTDDYSVVAGFLNGSVYAFGTPEKIREVFNQRIKGEIQRSPLTKNDIHNTVISNLLIRSVSISISKLFPSLRNNNKNLLWSTKVEQNHIVNGRDFKSHRAMKLKFIADSKYSYISFKPDLYIEACDKGPVSTEVKRDLKNTYFKKLFNGKYEQFIDDFQNLLFTSKNGLKFDFPVNSDNGFKFEIRPSPGYVKVMQAGTSKGVNISEKFNSKLLVHEAIQYSEPELVFTSLNGREVHDFHPMRGLIKNRPMVYPKT